MKSIFACTLTLLAIGVLIGGTGCANPYNTYYTNRVDPGRERFLAPYSGLTQYYSISGNEEARAAVERYEREGYVLLGDAGFEAAARDYSRDLRQKSAELGADIVLINSSFAKTVHGAIPVLTYKPGQTYTTTSNGMVNANVTGTSGTAFGSANYSGMSTTTSSGTYDTQYVPYSVNRNDYHAVFLRKGYFVVGWFVTPLDDQTRQHLQRNTGMIVLRCVEGSPAFKADILPGDIVIGVAGEAPSSLAEIRSLTEAHAGETIAVTILRAGAQKEITLKLNPMPPPVAAK